MSHYTTTPRRARRGVFVSYSRKDGEAFAIDLRKRITDRGIQVWQDLTHMEGGRDWWEQIKDALNQVEFMVLVMTPSAVHSEVVRKEWRYARQQGVCIYPVKADARIDIQSLPRWMSRVHWYDLGTNEQQSRFFNDLTVLCTTTRVPFMAEPLPADFIPREAEFAELKQQLLSHDQQEPVAITAAFRGAGGYGKTTLARALCHDEDIQFAFDDGILWITLGEKPTYSALLSKLRDLIRILSGDHPTFENLEAGKSHLNELLDDRDILLVIDDVWRSGDLMPFIGSGSRCARLITTRRVDVLPPKAIRVAVEQMTIVEATRLLGNGLTDCQTETLESLAARLGKWPLLLKLVNAWLRDAVLECGQQLTEAVLDVNALLDRNGITTFDSHEDEAERHEAVAKTLEISLARLKPEDQLRFQELAIFEEDFNIPLTVLERYWKFTGNSLASDVRATCKRLFNDSLLVDFRLQPDERFVRLHDAIRSWLINRPANLSLPERHEQLLTAYNPEKHPWHEIEDDGYLHIHLPRHLKEAGRLDELRKILLDIDWMYRRITLQSESDADVNGLVSAYECIASDAIFSQLQRTLRMSTHVLAKNPKQIGQQIFGRLGSHEDSTIKNLCQRAKIWHTEGQITSIYPTLNTPQELQFTLIGHTKEVIGAEPYENDQKILSWSDDLSIKTWNTQEGKLISTLLGHKKKINGVKVLNNNKTAISWSQDGTLRVWNIEQSILLKTLRHEDQINGVIIFNDNQRALSWSRDRTIIMWDIHLGRKLTTFYGHTGEIHGCTIIKEGEEILSWSADNTLRIWDIEQKKEVKTYLGHRNDVRDAIFINKTNQIISWSRDRTLIIWEKDNTSKKFQEDTTSAVLSGAHKAISWSSMSLDSRIRIWDLGQQKLIASIQSHSNRINGLALIDDNQAISWSDDKTIKIWDLETKNLQCTLSGHTQEVTGAITTKNKQKLLSWSEDKTLRLWGLEEKKDSTTLYGHEGRINGARLISSDKMALSWSADRTIRLWDIGTPSNSRINSNHASPVKGFTLAPKGKTAVSWSQDNHLKIVSIENGRTVRSLDHSGPVNGAILVNNDSHILSWSFDTTLRLWDANRTDSLLEILPHTGIVRGVVLIDQGKRFLSWSCDYIKIWHLTKNKTPTTISGHKAKINGILPIEEKLEIISWSDDYSIKLWDATSGINLGVFNGHQKSVLGVTVFNKGTQILSWSDDMTIRLWKTVNQDALQVLSGHEDTINGAVPLKYPHRAISWSDDSTIRIWDTKHGKAISILFGHSGPVNGVIIPNDGKSAISWSSDHTLRLWDLQIRELRSIFHGHTAEVIGAKIIKEGDRLLSWSNDRSLRLWNLNSAICLSTYFLDYIPTAITTDVDNNIIIVGDAGGHIHILELPSA